MAPELPDAKAELPAPEKPAPKHRTTATEVCDYLDAHPAFLAKHVDVLTRQTLPGQSGTDGERVIDFQHMQVQRLRSENERLRQFQTEVLTAARANVSAQALVHEAVLMLMEAESLEHLVHVITQDLAPALGIDVVTLCVEGSEGDGRPSVQNLHVLPEGTIDALLGPGKTVRLAGERPDDGTVFGPAAGLIESHALARLDLGEAAPLGLLALGSREATKYEAGQGSELLGFLGLSVERLLQLWLRRNQ